MRREVWSQAGVSAAWRRLKLRAGGSAARWDYVARAGGSAARRGLLQRVFGRRIVCGRRFPTAGEEKAASSARRKFPSGLSAHAKQYFLLARWKPRPRLKFDRAASDTNSPYAHRPSGVLLQSQPGESAGCSTRKFGGPGGNAGRPCKHTGCSAGGSAAGRSWFPADGIVAGGTYRYVRHGPAGECAAGRCVLIRPAHIASRGELFPRWPYLSRRKFDRAQSDTNSPYAHPLLLALSSVALLFAGLIVRHLASEFVRSIQDVSREFRAAVVTEVHETIWVLGAGVRYRVPGGYVLATRRHGMAADAGPRLEFCAVGHPATCPRLSALRLGGLALPASSAVSAEAACGSWPAALVAAS